MTNFLNAKCPNCGDTDRLLVEGTTWLHIEEEGAAMGFVKGWDYTPDSRAYCANCKCKGRLVEFEVRYCVSTESPDYD